MAHRSVLICLQGMDTSGKGGATKAIDRLLDPLGFSVTGFGAPSDEEKQHDHLWRHERALPEVGKVRLWDRSHYETVLIERVRGFVPEETWRARYDEINAWEAGLAERGVTVIKFMLHISRDEQKQRLLERLGDPTKHWKYNPGDVDERALWDDYQAAYSDALTRVLDRGLALVRGAGEPQVAPRLDPVQRAGRDAARDGPVLPAGRLRRGCGGGAGRGELRTRCRFRSNAGVSYTAFDGARPELTTHSAIAAEYAHTTAPLRRLVDRFVLSVCLALVEGREVDPAIREVLPQVPDLMTAAIRRSRAVDRESMDFLEAALLAGREGVAFRGVVIEQRRDDGIVQLSDPAITARCRGKDLPVGEWVDAWLSVADPQTRKVVFDVTAGSKRI